jgi:hypothetical protein
MGRKRNDIEVTKCPPGRAEGAYFDQPKFFARMQRQKQFYKGKTSEIHAEDIEDHRTPYNRSVAKGYMKWLKDRKNSEVEEEEE